MARKKVKKIDTIDSKVMPPYCAQVQIVGVNSEVMIRSFETGPQQVVCRYGVKKGGFAPAEAEQMIKDVVRYQNLLKRVRVPLPPIDDIYIESDYFTDRAIIIKESLWTGDEVADILRQVNPKRHKKFIVAAVRSMCQIVARVCRHHKNWQVKVGIDPRSTNFTVDKNGKMWFVDLFPPRFYTRGNFLVEWPVPKSELGKELGRFKHFDVRGMYLCMLAQLSRMRPELKLLFEKIVFSELKKHMGKKDFTKIMQEYQETPWIQLRSLLQQKNLHPTDKKKAKEIIVQALEQKVFGVPYYIYSWREIALELAHFGYVGEEELRKFFSESHFEDRLPEIILSHLQKSLFTFVDRVFKK